LKSVCYTNIENEEAFYRSRIKYFKYIYSVLSKYSNNVLNWLDFGCSYGHFLEFLHDQKIDCEGVEIAECVRRYAQKKGLIVYKDIKDLPEKKYDVVSLIDTLYLVNEPVSLIKEIYNITNDNGLLLLRITNRNWLAKIRKRLLKKDLVFCLGDATVSFSKKSISYLLENNGYKILKITSHEKGKVMNLKVKAFYTLSWLLNMVTIGLINISPGLIIIAKKMRYV